MCAMNKILIKSFIRLKTPCHLTERVKKSFILLTIDIIFNILIMKNNDIS
jgi:hypothetical protein